MKRAIAFLLLLGLGFLALRYAIGDDEIVTASGPRAAAEAPAPRGNSGVSVPQGAMNTTVEQRGRFEYPRTRAVPLPGGGARHERVFVLRAADSNPLGNGLQQLDGVEITLFDKDRPAALVTSRQAFVELGRDANGAPSLREDKALDLREVVLQTLPGARLEGLRMELGSAQVLVGVEDLQLRTPNELDPVQVVLDGKQRGSLRGKGLQARLPRNPKGALQRADIDILHEPVLETDGLVVRGRGRLHYTEDLATGAAQLTVAGVAIDLAAGRIGGRSTRDGTAHVAGDQLIGWLLRGKQRDAAGEPQQQLAWRLLQISGSPVHVDAPELRVRSPQLTILPGPFGEPFLISASGGPSRVEQLLPPDAAAPPGARPDGPVVGTAQRRIHVLRPAEQAGAVHRLFGFPQWTVRPVIDAHAIVFEGRSTLADDARSVEAAQGLRAFGSAAASGTFARGYGDIVLDQRARQPHEQDLHATGNDGFLLRSTATGERLDLGPPLPADPDAGDGGWWGHRYTLTHGAMTANGAGACRIEREAGRTRISLRAPADDIAASMPADGVELGAVRSLTGEFDDREVHDLRVIGAPATVAFRRSGETLFARAPLLLRSGQASLRLLPAADGPDAAMWRGLAAEDALPHLRRQVPASARRGAEQVDARAPLIELHHLGGSDVLVDVVGGAQPAHVTSTLAQLSEGEPTTVDVQARRLRLFPFAVSREALLAHAGGASGPVADLPFFTLRQPWLRGDGVDRIVVQDSQQGRIEGSGSMLLMSTGAEAGLFVGDPDTLTPATVTRTLRGRVVTARGARVRVFRDDGLRLQVQRAFPGRSTFLLPAIDLHQPSSDNAFDHLRAVCRGDIEVLTERVLFGGPVVVDSLGAVDAAPDAAMHIEAVRLQMERHRETGKILLVTGDDVQAEWRQLRATAARMELDLVWSLCTARDPAGARVDLANGLSIVAERVTVNFATLAYDMYRGRLLRNAAPETERR